MRSFEIRDPAGNAARFPSELLATAPLSHMTNCAKIIHGRAEIRDLSSNEIVQCRKSYVSLRATRDGILPETLVRDIFGPEIGKDEAISLLVAMRTTNTSFFKKLETELAHCCVHHLRGNPLTAFLHLYRSIEKLAVAFPLIYISGSHDFERSLENLRSYFADDKGELAFAKRFSEKFAEESSGLAEYEIDFETDLSEVNEFAKLVDEIKACCPNFIEDGFDPNDGKFSIPYVKVSSFIITCRNRLFHFSNNGARNFDIDRIGGVAELCRMLVEGGLHWLAMSFDEVLPRQTDRVIRKD